MIIIHNFKIYRLQQFRTQVRIFCIDWTSPNSIACVAGGLLTAQQKFSFKMDIQKFILIWIQEVNNVFCIVAP